MKENGLVYIAEFFFILITIFDLARRAITFDN